MLGIYDLRSGNYTIVEDELFDSDSKVVYCKINKTLLIKQPYFGTSIPIYFVLDDQKLYISDSLKKMKATVSIKFLLNKNMLPCFFYNGFLPGKHTLVHGVYKLPSRKKLIVTPSDICIDEDDEFDYTIKLNYDNLKMQYEDIMIKAIEESLTKADIDSEYALALSSGYDSNILLHYIRQKYPHIDISLFSVGGVKGVNETRNAYEISKKYKRVTFQKTLVSPETLQCLDDIVLRLEGSVYERGIFLQYELARLLNKNCVHHLICGECADQVFHYNTYVDVQENEFLYGYLDTPFEMAAYVVLKKSALMLKSYNIKGLYPFLNPLVIGLGYAARFENGLTKEFHKKRCEEILNKDVLKFVKKQGGTTALTALFTKGFDCYKAASESKFYSPDFRLTQKYSKEESIMDYYLSLKYIESFERQFCD